MFWDVDYKSFIVTFTCKTLTKNKFWGDFEAIKILKFGIRCSPADVCHQQPVFHYYVEHLQSLYFIIAL